MIDSDGYIHVMSRSDDIINVAAHRFSTGKTLPSIHINSFPQTPLESTWARKEQLYSVCLEHSFHETLSGLLRE